jgi:Flp pilus assembly protein TadD
VVFVGALLCAGYVGYVINTGEIGKTLNKRVLEKVLVTELEKKPGDARLYSILGTIYYEDKEYDEAIQAYEKALELAPRDPETLNNLAWLYATCEQEQYRQPSKALVYATHAAAMKPVPYILDTLAESYHVNGMREKAIETIKRALAMNPDDRAYYERQLDKFEKGSNLLDLLETG